MTDDRRPIDAGLVRRLIASQFPQFAKLPIRRVAADGWDNSSFRLGDVLKVRLPTASRYAGQPAKEHRWLPVLAPWLPLAVPEPLVLGAPGEGYPWAWSVQRWIEGDTAAAERIADQRAFAVDLARFLLALRRVPTEGGPPAGPHSFFRGGGLAVYDAETRRCLAAAGKAIDTAGAAAVWRAALDAAWRGPAVWVHGDVAAGNLLVKDGRLCAVIDFGACAVGDPACDLVAAWTFLGGEARSVFRATLAVDDATWARARGWALWKALLGLVDAAATPADAASSRRVIAEVLAEHRTATRRPVSTPRRSR